jgi:hypothetical protein
VQNRFQFHDFLNGFQIHNSILDLVPFEPEVLFIGTFNHGWSWNSSDFFFGRDMYMWTVLANLFIFNNNHLTSRRNSKTPIPSLNQIFDICQSGKMVFASLVKGINIDISAVEFSHQKYTLINNEYKWGSTMVRGKRIGAYSDYHIEQLGKNGWLEDNVDSILDFINENKTIKHIYFTFKSGNWLGNRLKDLCNRVGGDVSYCSIFSPTAKGFGNILDPPYNKRAWGLAHCWVWNGLEHKYSINKPGYGHLDHEWLKRNKVCPENF